MASTPVSSMPRSVKIGMNRSLMWSVSGSDMSLLPLGVRSEPNNVSCSGCAVLRVGIHPRRDVRWCGLDHAGEVASPVSGGFLVVGSRGLWADSPAADLLGETAHGMSDSRSSAQ